jgi:hypothetical protein
VLVGAGAYHPEWQVLNRKPFPRGDHAEAIVVDDRVVLAKVAAAAVELPREVQAFLADGAAALRTAGLGFHPAKSVRNSPHANPLGMELKGDVGLGGAERLRRFQLVQLSLHLAGAGRTTGAFRRALSSSWAFCAEARRPMLCLLDSLYRNLGDVESDPEVVPLQPCECTDLGLLSALAPLMVTDLRLPHSDRLLATDASDTMLAGCLSPIHPALHQECFRLRKSGEGSPSSHRS